MHTVVRLVVQIAKGDVVSEERLRRGIDTARCHLDSVTGRNPLREADTRWMLARLLREASWIRPVDVCDQLERILEIVEERRRAIEDLQHRASLVGRFPHLHDLLCDFQFRCGRISQAFRTIESSKGRFVADYLSAEESLPAIDLSTFVRSFSALAPTSTAYLTALTGQDDVFLILVTHDGETANRRIPIEDLIPGGEGGDRRALEELVARAQRLKWRPVREYLRAPVVDFRKTIAPIVSWLDPESLRGHLVFCPDGPLYNVPVHGLPFRGRRLGQVTSVSRIHGMHALLRVLEQPVRRPDEYLAVVVPSVEDLAGLEEKGDKRRKLAAFEDVPKDLERLLQGRGRTLAREHATRAAFEAQRDLTDRIVHFSAHGVAPKRIEQGPDGVESPLDRAAIQLASKRGLPRYLEFENTKGAGRLTPRRLLDEQVDASRSHVTMMACVSGIVEEGPGGDALGMEWAFLLRGAASVLSTYWNIDVAKVASFYMLFYRNWLEREMSRAEAFARAISQLGTESGDSDLDGFCLSGDWR